MESGRQGRQDAVGWTDDLIEELVGSCGEVAKGWDRLLDLPDRMEEGDRVVVFTDGGVDGAGTRDAVGQFGTMVHGDTEEREERSDTGGGGGTVHRTCEMGDVS